MAGSGVAASAGSTARGSTGVGSVDRGSLGWSAAGIGASGPLSDGPGGGLLIELDDDPRDEDVPRSGAGTAVPNLVRRRGLAARRDRPEPEPLPFAEAPLLEEPFPEAPFADTLASSAAGATVSAAVSTVPPARLLGVTGCKCRQHLREIRGALRQPPALGTWPPVARAVTTA